MMKRPFGSNPGDRWTYVGFTLRCYHYGVEIIGKNAPECLRCVYANDRRAEEAIRNYINGRAAECILAPLAE